MSEERMTKGEREDLQRLVRQREKVQKSAAKTRSMELMADFESQMAAEYRFDDDAVWAAAGKMAQAEVEKAVQRVADRCEQLGIPRQFAPNFQLIWRHRGYGNALDDRRKELRRVAQVQIAALEQKAITAIERASVEAQTEIAVAGLSSDAAAAFIARLPTVESLMPQLTYEAVAGQSETPLVEQLLTPNALRQRRFRERQQALRNGDVTLPAEETQEDGPASLFASNKTE